MIFKLSRIVTICILVCIDIFAQKDDFNNFLFISSRCYTVQVDKLNIRSKPTVNSNIVDRKFFGEEVCAEVDNGIWIKSKSGWAKKEFLDYKRSVVVPR